MKKYIIILICSFVVFSAKAQLLGKETWTKISHEVEQLVITNDSVQSELEKLLFCTKQDTLLSVFEGYEYFHLYVEEDTDCQTLEFRLNNYPYKSENLIGFFAMNGYLLFVHHELPDFLMSTGDKKTFTYIEHKLGSIDMMEDDTPTWIIEYKKPQLKLLHYPSKKY